MNGTKPGKMTGQSPRGRRTEVREEMAKAERLVEGPKPRMGGPRSVKWTEVRDGWTELASFRLRRLAEPEANTGKEGRSVDQREQETKRLD